MTLVSVLLHDEPVGIWLFIFFLGGFFIVSIILFTAAMIQGFIDLLTPGRRLRSTALFTAAAAVAALHAGLWFLVDSGGY